MKRWIVGQPGSSPRAFMVIPNSEIACNVEDGEVYFTQDELPDAPFIINDAGDALVSIERPLAEAKVAKWAAVKLHRMITANGGCLTGLGPVDTDPESRAKVAGAVQMAMLAQIAGASFSIQWTMKNNALVDHDAAAMIAMGLAVGQHVDLCHQRAVALRSLIDAADDLATLNEIDVSAGWPTV